MRGNAKRCKRYEEPRALDMLQYEAAWLDISKTENARPLISSRIFEGPALRMRAPGLPTGDALRKEL